MTRHLVVTGKTESEAVQSALAQLQAGPDDVEIDVLSVKKGLFGLGAKQVTVRVRLKAAAEAKDSQDDPASGAGSDIAAGGGAYLTADSAPEEAAGSGARTGADAQGDAVADVSADPGARSSADTADAGKASAVNAASSDAHAAQTDTSASVTGTAAAGSDMNVESRDADARTAGTGAGIDDDAASGARAHRHSVQGRAWVQDGGIYCEDPQAGGDLPVVTPCEGITLFVNGEAVSKAAAIKASDVVRVECTVQMNPAEWDIKVSSDKMQAVLQLYAPATRVTYRLMDSTPRTHLMLETTQTSEILPMQVEPILQRMGQMRVTYGVKKQALQAACQAAEPGRFVVAEGIPLREGADGYFEAKQELTIQKNIKERADGTVDFKEIQEFPSVEAGELVGILHAPVPGISGTNVFGEEAAPRDVFPLHLTTGKGIALIGDSKVIATATGHPNVKRTGRAMHISLAPKITIDEDITLKTGNIHYYGDVEVSGAVQDGMAVEASGNILVRQNINMAKATAGESVIVHQNIIGGTVTAGQSMLLLKELTQLHQSISDTLQQIEEAVDQLAATGRGANSGGLAQTGTGRLVRMICDSKFPAFLKEAAAFCNKITASEKFLDDPWQKYSKQLRAALATVDEQTQSSNAQQQEGSEGIVSKNDLSEVVQRARRVQEQWLQAYNDTVCLIQASYVHNSELNCHGDVSIHGKGCFNTKIHADGLIHIKGNLRGGSIFAGKGAHINVAGTPGGAPTSITVPKGARITIKRAHENTTLQIGPAKQKLLRTTDGINAVLDTDGRISLHQS